MQQRHAWPFVGRATVLGELLALRDDPQCGGVVLVGPAGIGKSRLAEQVLAAAAADGAALGRLVATPAGRTVPYSAIVHLLPTEVLQQPGSVDPLRVFQAVRAMCPPGDRQVLFVDDINQLDEASLSLITQLHAADALFLVGTAHDDGELSPAVDAVIRAVGLRRLVLGALTSADVSAIAADVVGGTIDASTAADLWDRTAGNPLYLRELLLGAMATTEGRTGDSVHLRFDAGRNARLAELVAERVRGLDADVSATLSLLAVAEPLLVDDLDRAGLLDHAAELEDRGLITVDRDGARDLVRLSHPVHGEVLRGTMGVFTRRREVRRAIELIAGRPAPLRGDGLRVALWRLDVGEPTAPDALVAGAYLARAALDLPSTHRLASAALEVEANHEARYLLAEALFLMGHLDDAEALAATALDDPALPTRLRLLVLAVRVNNLVWGHGDGAAAERAITEQGPALAAAGLGAAARILEANVAVYSGHPERALELLGPLPDEPYALMLGAAARGAALTVLGRAEEALHVSTHAYEVQMALPDPNAFLDPSTHLLTQGVALVALGHLGEADACLAGAHAAAEQQRVTFMRSLHATALGESSLRAGRLHDARLWFHEAHHAGVEVNLRPLQRLALAGLAAVAGQLGDPAAAVHALADLGVAPTALHFGAAEEAAGRAWCLSAVGRPAEGRALLREAVGVALDHGELWMAVSLVGEAVRLGDADWDPAVLARLDAVDGPLAAALVALARARAVRSPEPLAAAAAALAGLGVALMAAEAEVALAERWQRAGDPRAAGAATQRAESLLARCQGARTPGSMPVDAVVPLSAREREIALLAADGLSSREIADRLFLSVRTVDNHLQKVYVKLGVNGRGGLAGTLPT
ncbi:MAG: LuxR C-terminal-related transcriptional regulator [Ilumatobacteraceae bacterium]